MTQGQEQGARSEATKARLVRLQQAAKEDLAQRELLGEVEGLELDERIEQGQTKAFSFEVHLAGGEVIAYTMDNVDNAPIYCGDELLSVEG